MDGKRDLRVRTKKFASAIIRLYCRLSKVKPEVQVVGRQVLRSGTSVAGNYREASRARSRAEFVSKIDICAQEADETQLWLELLKEDCGVSGSLVDDIWQESDELISILWPCRGTRRREIMRAKPYFQVSGLRFQVSL